MKKKNPTSKTVKTSTKHSPAKLAQEVKEKALSLGAHLVGIAPISRMRNAPPELNPKRLLPDAKSLVSMAYRLNRGADEAERSPFLSVGCDCVGAPDPLSNRPQLGAGDAPPHRLEHAPSGRPNAIPPHPDRIQHRPIANHRFTARRQPA